MNNDKKLTSMDALEFLKSDHDMVKELFAEFESLGDRAFAKKKKIADEICSELTIHASIEEEIFYPTIRNEIKESSDLLDEAYIEHTSAKELISKIQSLSPEDDFFDATVHVLSEQIEHHVKEEEGEMFPLVRKSNLDLGSLGKKMQEAKEKISS